MSYQAERLSIDYIRYIANTVRLRLKLGTNQCVNILRILDVLSIMWLDKGFNYQIVEDDDTRFLSPDEEAKTDILSGTIYIKRHVYDQAYYNSGGRAIFTIAHEIGHFVLHKMMNKIIFARNEANANVWKGDPEWQADAFASEFLMPYEGCINLTDYEIMRKYGVSKSAASYRYDEINN